MGVSKNRGVYPPKWMVKIRENPIRIDDLGVFPLFLENTHIHTGMLLQNASLQLSQFSSGCPNKKCNNPGGDC